MVMMILQILLSQLLCHEYSYSIVRVDAFVPKHTCSRLQFSNNDKNVMTTTSTLERNRKIHGLTTIDTFHSLSTNLISTVRMSQQQDDNDEDEDKQPENPYQDPNYPDLEFVNYADPEYQVDQGVGDEFFDETSTEEQVEAMREERRVKNDEYQFETYYKEILKNGEEFKGEWMVYHTSTFTDGEVDSNGRPRLAKAAGPIKVISRGERIELEPPSSSEVKTNRLQYQRIVHHEKVFNDSSEKKTEELKKQEEISMKSKFWPEELSSIDFRGQQGTMVVGNAYTICTANPLIPETTESAPYEGPFAEYRAELGLLSDAMRFRIKLDYAVVDKDKDKMQFPPLHLKSFTVCRETLGMWPRAENYKSAIEQITTEALWGPRGAHGGLYDPPPVGSEIQASQYLLLDLEGRVDCIITIPYGPRPGSSWWRLWLGNIVRLDARNSTIPTGPKDNGWKKFAWIENA